MDNITESNQTYTRKYDNGNSDNYKILGNYGEYQNIFRIYSNIPPQTQGGNVEANLSLETRARKRPGGCALVNTSAN